MPKKKSVKKVDAEVKDTVSESQPLVIQVTEEAKSPEKSKVKFFLRKKTWVYVGAIVLVGGLLAIPGVYYYQQYDKAQRILSKMGAQENVDSGALVEEIGKIYELPVGEDPTVATVSDLASLKKSEGYTQFFARAQNGDKVLIYAQAKKAILYRPSTNKIIEVGPVSTIPQNGAEVAGAETTASGSAQKEESTPTPSSTPVTITILNGTKTAGLAKKAQSQLSDMDSVKVISTGNAVNDQEQTIVVDVTGKNEDIAATLASKVGGSASELPEDEAKPNSDLLIILGQNYGK